MPRRRTSKRKLKKRQGPSRKQVAKGIENLISVREGYQALLGMKQMASAIKDNSKGRGTKMKKKDPATRWSNNNGDGIKYKTVTLSYKKNKRGKLTAALTEPGTTYTYVTGGAVSGVGVQNTTLLTNVLGAELQGLFVALQNGAGINTLRISNQLHFLGSRDEIEFMNCSPTTMEFDIWILVDKTSNITTLNPLTVWDTALSQEANDAVAPLEDKSTPWLRPNAYKAFNITFWSKRHPCTLTPGEKCKLTYNFNRNRVIDTSYITNYSSIRGITHRILVVQRGTLVDGSNDKVVGAANQSLSETKLVWLRKTTIRGAILSGFPRVTKQFTSTMPTALAAQWAIDEDSGDPENAAIATEFA